MPASARITKCRVCRTAPDTVSGSTVTSGQTLSGNKTPLQPGMCFSDEPTVVIYGEFGMRLEDCLYITANGPKFFTRQSPSIEEPFG